MKRALKSINLIPKQQKEDELKEKDKEITSYQRVNKLLSDKHEKMSKDMISKDEQIALLRDNLGNNNEQIAAKDEELASLQITKEDSIASMKDALKNKNIELVGKEDEIKSVNASLSVSGKVLKSRYEEIVMLKDTLKKKNDQISARDEEITDLIIKNMDTRRKMAERDAEIALLEDTLKEKDELRLLKTEREISMLRGKLASRDETIASHLKKIDLIERSLELLRDEVALKERAAESLQVNLKNKNDQIIAKDEKITSLVIARRRTQHQPKVLTVQLGQEHTTCSICLSKFSTDTDLNNKDNNITKHLPVLSASSKSCDHYFCHGCISKATSCNC